MSIDRVYGGAYEAARAAALSGVPKSTVYDWARKGVVVPSVSATQEKLWSFADLMALRAVSWLRHDKRDPDGDEIPSSPMPQVRAALDALGRANLDIWSTELESPLVVERSGKVLVRVAGELHDPLTGATALPDAMHSYGLTGPFDIVGMAGPDLLRPRPHLRIIPGKVSGEPHVYGTRITTTALASLTAEGYDPGAIARMYDLPVATVMEADSLEKQLGTFAQVA